MALTSLHVAVMSADKLGLSYSILNDIYDGICSHLTEQLNLKGVVPRFVGEPVIHDGVLKLTCLDEDTKKWLKEVVNKLPAEQGLRNKCFFNDEIVPKIPNIKLVTQEYLRNMTKCHILVPYGEYTSIKETMEMLNKMNPEVEVQKWLLLDTLHSKDEFGWNFSFHFEDKYAKVSKDPKSIIIIPVRIPNDIMECIKTQLYYGLRTVTLEVVTDQKK